MRPLHGLTQRSIHLTQKQNVILVESAGALIHLGTACFRRHSSEGNFCRSKALEASFFGAPRLGFGWEHAARLSDFFKLASCIAIFGGAWHANSRGNLENRMIALSNPTKNRSVGSFVCCKSFREKVFPCMSQAMIKSSLARNHLCEVCLWKANFADSGF